MFSSVKALFHLHWEGALELAELAAAPKAAEAAKLPITST